MPRDPAREESRDESVTSDDERWLCCKSCETLIAQVSAILPEGEMPLVFANPHGVVFELVLLGRAQALRLIGSRTEEFTWFQGYAWRVALCGGCGSHLGWRFEAVRGGSPALFFGLLRRELVERDASVR
jgi:Yippee zinc-binding/DNA-binding /Mis18, centromere assembly